MGYNEKVLGKRKGFVVLGSGSLRSILSLVEEKNWSEVVIYNDGKGFVVARSKRDKVLSENIEGILKS